MSDIFEQVSSAKELLRKAEKVCYDYKAVYGKFPAKIGVRHDNPFPLPPSIVIMELNPVPVQWTVQELNDESINAASYTRHAIWLEPIAGAGIKPDEVYVTVPGDWDPFRNQNYAKVMDGAFVAKLAREFVE